MDRDFLFAIFAVQLGLVRPEKVMGLASAWLADRSQGLADRLVESGAIDSAKRAMLEGMVEQAVEAHGGDVKETLHTVGGERALYASFGGSVALDEAGAPTIASQAEGASAEDAGAVSTEHPGRYVYRGGGADAAEIGRGGIGRVLIAHDEHLGREIALKELLGEGGGAPGTPVSRTAAASARFLRETKGSGASD